ncbi:MAG: sensor histidine kinase [Acidimicrobiales bacterium]
MPTMRRRILILTVLHLGLAALLGAAGWATGRVDGLSWAVPPFAVAVALVGSVRMNVELGRHACGVTMVDAVVVAMLLHLTPAEVVAAAVLGEVLVCAWQRQAVSKLLYNAASTVTAAGAAAAVFSCLGGAGASDGATWSVALLAAGSYATATHASTSAVLAVVEGRRFGQVFCASLVPVAMASAISATVGLAAVVLYSVRPVAVLLVAPMVLVMVLETRRLALQRAEQLRFERLYAASSRTGGLTALPEVMATLAEEARALVTGAAGLCCTADAGGQWSGVLVGDADPAPVPAGLLAALLGVTGPAGAAEVHGDQVPAAVRRVLGSTASVVVARSADDAAAPVLLAVLRRLGGEGGARQRAEVVGAFVGHAALTVANARLYADVEEALAHQVDLNRQKDDFVSAVSHELRTPLAATIGSVLTLRRMDERLDADKRRTLVDLAYRQAKRLQRLIEELLTLATVENGEAPRINEPVSLDRMVDDIVDELRTQRAGQELPAIRFHDAGVGPIRSAEQKLRQILANLVENACKYAPGSPIDVRLEPGQASSVRIHVVDAGPGIPPADRERVFERFVQLDQSSTRSQGGTGLGLYLCRQVAVLLGGRLELFDGPEGGCCFTLTLPCATEPDERDARRLLAVGELAGATTAGDPR